MTLEELKEKQLKLYNKYMDGRHHLFMQYAVEHSPYKIGDIVQDHLGRIRVEVIGLHMSYHNDVPTCVYSGTELKADGTPKKNGAKRQVFQSNIK